jgi:predicted O-linked N-acetylglucosamine transferase (SPINDLY family)
MFEHLVRRAVSSDKPFIVRLVRLALAWLLIHAPRSRQRALADRVGDAHAWNKIKAVLFGVRPNGLERRLIAAARQMQGDRIAAIVALSLFQYGYEFLEDGLDWADKDVLWRPYLFYIAFEFPLIFHSVDDQARAVGHAERLIRDAMAAFDAAGPERREKIAIRFATAYNFNPALFSTRNIKPFAASAGRLLEYHLIRSGHALDHDFPVPRRAGRQRVGVIVRNIERRTESFIAPAFVTGLDRSRFETVLITLAEPADAGFAAFVAGHFDRMVVFAIEDVGEQAEAIRALDLDLLFPANTMAPVTWVYNNLLAHRLARVQLCATIVSPLTTGLTRTDFVLTAPGTEPPGFAAQYSEKVLAMEGMFNCFILGDQDPRTPRPRDPAAAQLPAVPVRFASGGSLYKLTPALRQAWIRILKAVPDSELALYPFNPGWGLPRTSAAIRRVFVDEFVAAGIAEHRLRLLPNQTPFQIVDLLRDTDVYLDTFPYSGAASFMEPIAALCPMVGLRGVTQRGLQGAAMLTVLGLEDMIAEDVDGYVALAIELARSPAFRAALKQRVKARLDALPFLDSADYGRRLTASLDQVLVASAESGVVA